MLEKLSEFLLILKLRSAVYTLAGHLAIILISIIPKNGFEVLITKKKYYFVSFALAPL